MPNDSIIAKVLHLYFSVIVFFFDFIYLRTSDPHRYCLYTSVIPALPLQLMCFSTLMVLRLIYAFITHYLHGMSLSDFLVCK